MTLNLPVHSLKYMISFEWDENAICATKTLMIYRFKKKNWMKRRPEPLKSAITSHIFHSICHVDLPAFKHFPAFMLLFFQFQTFAKVISFFGTVWTRKPVCREPIFFLKSFKKKKKKKKKRKNSTASSKFQ